jgi:hypothetical protein
VTLLLPFAVLTYWLAVCRPGARVRVYLIGSLAVVFLLMTSTSTNGVWEILDETAKQAQVYGAYVWAYLVLVAALTVVLRQGEKRSSLAVDCDLDMGEGTYQAVLCHSLSPSKLQSAQSSRCRMPFDIGDRSKTSTHGVLGDHAG